MPHPVCKGRSAGESTKKSAGFQPKCKACCIQAEDYPNGLRGSLAHRTRPSRVPWVPPPGTSDQLLRLLRHKSCLSHSIRSLPPTRSKLLAEPMRHALLLPFHYHLTHSCSTGLSIGKLSGTLCMHVIRPPNTRTLVNMCMPNTNLSPQLCRSLLSWPSLMSCITAACLRATFGWRCASSPQM